MGMSGAERQARYRARQADRMRELEATLASRDGAGQQQGEWLDRLGAVIEAALEEGHEPGDIMREVRTMLQAMRHVTDTEERDVTNGEASHVTPPCEVTEHEASHVTNAVVCHVTGCDAIVEQPTGPGRKPKYCADHRGRASRRRAGAP